MAKFFADMYGETLIDSWEKGIKVRCPEYSMTLYCVLFYNEGYHDCVQLRINQITVGGLSIIVTGGPQSHADVPNIDPHDPPHDILSKDISDACERLLGNIQRSVITAEWLVDDNEPEDEEPWF